MNAVEKILVEEAPEADAPFVVVMKIWANWMSLKDRAEAGGWSHPQDVKEFMRIGETVNTMVNDLPSAHRWAIWRAYGISTVWIYPNLPLYETLIEAEKKLTPKMLQKVDLVKYFPLGYAC